MLNNTLFFSLINSSCSVAFQIPESREIFTLRLINATGGAQIDTALRQAEVRISENDAPIRFAVSQVTFGEPHTQQIRVLRGIGPTGARIGPIQGTSSISYRTVAGTAHSGIDYRDAQGKLTFGSGSTERTISIEILTDPQPELMENFTIELYNPSGGGVLVSPTVLVVNIASNDDPNGIISFNATSMNNIPDLILDEESGTSGTFNIFRSKGTFGEVIVYWRTVPGSRSPGISPYLIISPSNGSVVFPAGTSRRSVSVLPLADSIPEVAQELIIELFNVTGGARLASTTDGIPKARVIVRDSDHAYGIVELGPGSQQRVSLVSG